MYVNGNISYLKRLGSGPFIWSLSTSIRIRFSIVKLISYAILLHELPSNVCIHDVTQRLPYLSIHYLMVCFHIRE